MPSLYVLEPGARLEVEHLSLLVTHEDKTLVRVPLRLVSQIVLVGRVGATTPALHELLKRNISTVFLDGQGHFLGRLVSPGTYHLPLRLAQYRRNEDKNFGLAFSRVVVCAKIHNQGVVARRWARRSQQIQDGDIDRLGELEHAAEQAESIDSLLGFEGSAARFYFEIMGKKIDPEWNFEKRNRRPPRDPLNALLSLGYTLLTWCIGAALQTVGLDPELGYFHKESYGKPALALDMLEEFRASLIDSLALSLASHRILTPQDFIPGKTEYGVYLKPSALRAFVEAYNQKLNSTITLPEIGRPLSFRKLLEVQAHKLAKWVENDAEDYRPYRAR